MEIGGGRGVGLREFKKYSSNNIICSVISTKFAVGFSYGMAFIYRNNAV